MVHHFPDAHPCVGAILAQRKRALVAAQRTRAAQSREKQLAISPLLAAPLVACASGATVRNILDTVQGNALAEDQPAIVNTLIGVIAGGKVALLFLLGQLVAVPDSADTKTAALHARGLAPFAVCLGFIGGLTLDAVFESCVPRTSCARTPHVINYDNPGPQLHAELNPDILKRE